VIRVLLVSRFDPFEPRPQPLQVLSTAIGLERCGAQVTLVMDSHHRSTRNDVAEHLGQDLGPGLDLRLVHGLHPGARGLKRRLLLTRLARQSWDGVLTRDFKLTPLLTRLGLRVIHEWHAVPTAQGQGDEGESRAAEAAAAHVFVTQGLRDFVAARDRRLAGPILVAPNGCFCDPAAAERRIGSLHAADEIVVAGLFRRPTDAALLAAIADSLPNHLRLVVAGAAPDDVTRSSRVTALGTVPPARIPSLIDGALGQLALYRDDLNTQVFASPMKVVSALASGVPLIATDLPTVRALTGSDALLVTPGDPDAVVDAVRRLDADREDARRIARNALRRAAVLDWEQRGAAIIEFLGEAGG